MLEYQQAYGIRNHRFVVQGLQKRSGNFRYASERLQEKYSAATAADVKGEEYYYGQG